MYARNGWIIRDGNVLRLYDRLQKLRTPMEAAKFKIITDRYPVLKTNHSDADCFRLFLNNIRVFLEYLYELPEYSANIIIFPISKKKKILIESRWSHPAYSSLFMKAGFERYEYDNYTRSEFGDKVYEMRRLDWDKVNDYDRMNGGLRYSLVGTSLPKDGGICRLLLSLYKKQRSKKRHTKQRGKITT